MAKFKVVGRNFDGKQKATVTIDKCGPDAALMHVRAHGRHEVHTLPLDYVAAMVIWQSVKAKVAQAKKTRRRVK